MSLIGSSNEEKIWNYFSSKGLNDYGCAGLIGNIFAESGLNPKNLQSNGNKKLDMTDDEYTIAVDNGIYTNFVKDSFGYGLVQHTFHTRKKALYEYAKSVNKSIGDLEMQLDFIYKELSESYKSVFCVLQTATSVLQASNAVLFKYEKPADQSETVQNKRAGYGQKYYDKYAKKNTTQNSAQEEKQMGINVNSLLAIFEKMYREHWPYIWGAAREGCVDCSGAFVYAYKQFGKSIYHGSNRIARKYVGSLQPISKAQPGWAAFKWKKDGAPSEYTDGKGNYYHIGLIDNTGKYVLNAKSERDGFSRDAIGSWHYVAPLNAVDYNEIIVDGNNNINMPMLYKATVITQSGSLNLRNAPNGERIGNIPRNSIIDVLNDSDVNWWQVRYIDKIGYASTEYLEKNTSNELNDYTDTNFNVGDKVKLVDGATYTSGKSVSSWVFDKTLYIRQLNKNSAVVSTLKTGAITGAVALKYLIKVESNSSSASFAPYNVKVNVDNLNIRKGAGKNYGTNGKIKDRGTYTIIDEADGIGSSKWLCLENGQGWIASEYVTKI